MVFDDADDWMPINEFAEAVGLKVAGVRSLILRKQVETSGEWGNTLVSLCSYVRFLERCVEEKKQKQEKRRQEWREHRKEQYKQEKEERKRMREERKKLGIKTTRAKKGEQVQGSKRTTKNV